MKYEYSAQYIKNIPVIQSIFFHTPQALNYVFVSRPQCENVIKELNIKFNGINSQTESYHDQSILLFEVKNIIIC